MGNLTATCTKCDVALDVEDIHNDESIVKCLSCGEEFGKWGDVKVELKELVNGKFEATPWVKLD